MSAIDFQTLITSPVLQSLLSSSKTTQETALSLISTSTDPDTPAPHHSTLLSQLSHLRTLHRQTTLALRATKAETSSARADVDSLHLTLQNLLYEQSHLRTEIEACESYSHPYTDLPLEDVTDFLSSHPELADVDAHALTLARIEHERVQREELEKERLALLKKKQALVKENLKRKEDLQGLDGRMEAFIDAARPIEKVLGLGDGEKEKNAVVGTEESGGKDASAG